MPKVDLFKSVAHNSAEMTARCLDTLVLGWQIKIVGELPESKSVIVRFPSTSYALSPEYRIFAGVEYTLCDNGQEINVEPINQPERLKPYFEAGLRSIPSSSNKFTLTAEVMAHRLWCAMAGQPIDYNDNDMPELFGALLKMQQKY